MLREKQRPVAAVSADKGAILKLEADAKVQYRPAFIDNKQIMAKQILADRKAVNNIVKSFSPPDKVIVHKKESNELNNGLFDVKKFQMMQNKPFAIIHKVKSNPIEAPVKEIGGILGALKKAQSS